MSYAAQEESHNRLLASPPREDADFLASISRLERPVQGRTLTDHSAPVGNVWFPRSGVAALVTTDTTGRGVQAGPIGREGGLGLETGACNRLHRLLSRCCRWLLTLQDRVARDELPLTQESLATPLGGGLPPINALLSLLERNGLVRRHRVQIRVLTRSGLEAQSCKCGRISGHPCASPFPGGLYQAGT
jgi:hypothetical protein